MADNLAAGRPTLRRGVPPLLGGLVLRRLLRLVRVSLVALGGGRFGGLGLLRGLLRRRSPGRHGGRERLGLLGGRRQLADLLLRQVLQHFLGTLEKYSWAKW